MALFGLYESKKEKTARLALEETRRIEERNKQQKQLGFNLLERLSRAASRNKFSNVLPGGQVAQEVKPIQIEVLPNNGGSYSVIAGMPDSTCMTGYSPTVRGYPVLQADIDLTRAGKELSATFGPYGPNRDAPVTEFERFAGELERVVESYRLFKE